MAQKGYFNVSHKELVENRVRERNENFMNDDKIFDMIKNNLKGNTAESYINRLSTLTKLLKKNIFNIMMSADASYMNISKYYDSPSTKKNFLTSILSVFKFIQMNDDNNKGIVLNKIQKHALERWHTFHKNLSILEEERYKSSEPTQKEQDKYVSFHDIQAKYFEIKSKHRSVVHKNLTSSMQFIFLSIVVHTPPKRCDYAKMKIYWNEDPDKTNENYIVLHYNPQKNNSNTTLPKESYFVFNTYKTSKHYDRVDQIINDELKTDIIESLKKYEREYLFVNRFGKPYENNSAFSKFVIRTFENLFDRPCGATMLRHIYISEVIDHNKWSEKEKEEVSKLMLHSPSLQSNYRWKSTK